ncbi:hypothetical protein [Piscinibacter defluvii]|uniref:hypothetical protein n=1 Tax=Piscinibacter defluvii TaxID=1796922 RepID=UPI000FDDA9DB|nr:hypothetical protein [Piscinibacter defluvii]
MKPLPLLATLSLVAAAYAQPNLADTSCAKDAVAAREERAAAGDAKAQYWLGTELETGRCVRRDVERSLELLRTSAARSFPPAVHVIGVILRREGQSKAALVQFERAADLGFQLGFVDMGFTLGASELTVYDATQAFAWLSLALARETNPRLQAYLEKSLKARADSMSSTELERARVKTEELKARFAMVPRWQDTQ